MYGEMIDWVELQQLFADAWQAGYVMTAALWYLIYRYGVCKGRLYEQACRVKQFATGDDDSTDGDEDEDDESYGISATDVLQAVASATTDEKARSHALHDVLIDNAENERDWLRKQLERLLEQATSPAIVMSPPALQTPPNWNPFEKYTQRSQRRDTAENVVAQPTTPAGVFTGSTGDEWSQLNAAPADGVKWP